MLKKKWVRGAIYAIDKKDERIHNGPAYTIQVKEIRLVNDNNDKGGKTAYVQYKMCWELI